MQDKYRMGMYTALAEVEYNIMIHYVPEGEGHRKNLLDKGLDSQNIMDYLSGVYGIEDHDLLMFIHKAWWNHENVIRRKPSVKEAWRKFREFVYKFIE